MTGEPLPDVAALGKKLQLGNTESSILKDLRDCLDSQQGAARC